MVTQCRLLVTGVTLAATLMARNVASDEIVEHTKACDASAVVFVTPNLMLVANDEDNTLRLYETESEGRPPVHEVDLAQVLQATSEVDIEGAAWLGDRIYWIGSHGRNRNGKWRADRLRLFATRVEVLDGKLVLRMVGHVVTHLLDVLLKDPRLQNLGLRTAVGTVGQDETKALAPEQGGVNIEGLSATPDGRRLLIAFRNPLPQGKALLVPLENPAQVVDEDGSAARLGEPILLDLGGRGVRSIDWCVPCRSFLIVAGPHDAHGDFVLFRWSGIARETANQVRRIDGLRPEGLAVAPDGRVRIVSDDGDEPHNVAANGCREELDNGRCACKDLSDSARRRFRSAWLGFPD